MFTRLKFLMVYLLFQFPRVAFYQLISLVNGHNKWKGRRYQPVLFLGKGRIHFGAKTVFGCFPSPTYFNTYCHLEARQPDSFLKIGTGVLINNNFVAIADCDGITIGDNVLIGFNVEIVNSDFHGILPSDRLSQGKFSPVIIDDNVFIGSNVRIMKGVRIKTDSVIANGSVVVKDIPENCVAGGNPCKIINEF